MYLVMFENPDGADEAQFCTKDRVNQYVEYFKTKGKNKNIFICQVQERINAIVDVHHVHYIINDKGEVIPK